MRAGDFNLPDINHRKDSTVGTKDKQSSEQVFNKMFNFSLTQVFKVLTRVQRSTSSVPDLAFMSGSLSASITVDDDISDHKILVLSVRSTDMVTGHHNKPSHTEM